VTFAVPCSTAIGLIIAGSVIDVALIALLVHRSRSGKTGQRSNAPWPVAALLVLAFVAILVGAGALH
jgi:hypothetical protein